MATKKGKTVTAAELAKETGCDELLISENDVPVADAQYYGANMFARSPNHEIGDIHGSLR